MSPGAARRTLSFLLLIFCLVVSTTAAAQTLSGRVSWVYDGDTLKLDGVGKVRLLGIDTPEKEDSERDGYYLRRGISRERLRAVAQQALRRGIELAKGKVVTLEVDGDGRDRHGRLLAYVILPDGRMLNRILLAEGLASVYRKFEFGRKEEFLLVEEGAKERGVGLWGE